MPSKTHGDKIEALQQLTTTLAEQFRALSKQVDGTSELHLKLKDSFGEFQVQFALVQKDIQGLHQWKDDCKKEKEESIRRWWSFGPTLTSVFISSFIALISIGVNIYLTIGWKK
jgi:hypothetical protein